MPSAVLTKEITRPTVLFRVLVWRQQIECSNDLSAHRWNRVVRYDEDKIVATNVPDKSVFATRSLHHVVQQLRQNSNDPVAFVVAVTIVEFLEVIQVGVANGEVVSE